VAYGRRSTVLLSGGKEVVRVSRRCDYCRQGCDAVKFGICASEESVSLSSGRPDITPNVCHSSIRLHVIRFQKTVVISRQYYSHGMNPQQGVNHRTYVCRQCGDNFLQDM